MILVSDIQFLIGIIALCIFVILLCIEGNVRLRQLFRDLSGALDWGSGDRTAWGAFTLRQTREARVFYYGLPEDPRIPPAARAIARKFRWLSLIHMLVGWTCWYILLSLGALEHFPSFVTTCLYLLPPAAAITLRLLILPWPDGDVWHGEIPNR